jgi:Holliday junction DNA helicase RuvA
MIGFLKGTVHSVSGDTVILDVQGVGYEVWASLASRERAVIGESASFVIHTEVQETMIRLYGFLDHLEKQVFHLLTTVKGVGAKSASEIISKVDKVELLKLIAGGDPVALQRVKGIGKKTAERIVVELKDKVGDYVLAAPQSLSRQVEVRVSNDPMGEALAGLMALGFPKRSAEEALAQAKAQGLSAGVDAGEIVKQALRFF